MSTAPVTRAERRAAARQSVHSASPRKRQSAPRLGVAIAALVLVAAIGLFLYAALYGSSSPHTVSAKPVKPMVDAAALNPAASLLQVGSKAPDFKLRDAFGASYHLAAQRGHPMLVEFYAVWCPVCHREAAVVNKLTKTYSSRGLATWAVVANPYGRDFEASNRTDLRIVNPYDLAWYAQTYHLQYPQLIDPKFATVNKYGVDAYPGLYVIDRSGKVAFASKGFRDFKTVAASIQRALAK